MKKESDWKKIWSREYTFQYCEAALEAVGGGARGILPFIFREMIIISEKGNVACYCKKRDESDFIKAIVKSFTSDKKSFSNFRELFNRFGKEYEEFTLEVYQKDLNGLKDKELESLYLEYLKRQVKYSALVWAAYYLNEYWSGWANSVLKGVEDEVRGALMAPIKKSTVLEMQKEARMVARGDLRIQDFWKKYRWIPCLDLKNKPWTLEEVKKYIEELEPEKEIRTLDFQKALEKIELSEEELEKLRMVKELGYIKDARDDYRRRGIFNIQKLFEEIGKRMGLRLDEVSELARKEIQSFLRGKKIKVDVLERKNEGFVMKIEGGKVVFSEDKKDVKKEMIRLGLDEEVIGVLKKVKGLSAFSGKVEGLVKIVRRVEDLKKVKKGDILVAVTTHPDYVVAMQKAAGIITDEGGTLSHAAIVSRELRIPCVVGTSQATRIFKDGDLVQVDAENGVVNLKR
jgi:phosphohistidine swiveling domain-containing protein